MKSEIVDYIKEVEIFDLESLEEIAGMPKGRLKFAVAGIIELPESESLKLERLFKVLGIAWNTAIK